MVGWYPPLGEFGLFPRGDNHVENRAVRDPAGLRVAGHPADRPYAGRMTPASALAAAQAFLLHPPVTISDQSPLSPWLREITEMVEIARQHLEHMHPRESQGSIRRRHNKRHGGIAEPFLAFPLGPPGVLMRVNPPGHVRKGRRIRPHRWKRPPEENIVALGASWPMLGVIEMGVKPELGGEEGEVGNGANDLGSMIRGPPGEEEKQAATGPHLKLHDIETDHVLCNVR